MSSDFLGHTVRQVHEPSIYSYPGRRYACKVASARSLRDGEPWCVIEQLASRWYTAISVSLLNDPHVTTGVPYRTVAVFERGQRVTA